VNFESIELRAKEMMVSGNGHLDFNTGRVGMSFTTQSTNNWLKVPVVKAVGLARIGEVAAQDGDVVPRPRLAGHPKSMNFGPPGVDIVRLKSTCTYFFRSAFCTSPRK